MAPALDETRYCDWAKVGAPPEPPKYCLKPNGAKTFDMMDYSLRGSLHHHRRGIRGLNLRTASTPGEAICVNLQPEPVNVKRHTSPCLTALASVHRIF